MEYRLLQGLNLLKQLDLSGGGPCTATCPEYVEEVVIGDGDGEAAIDNHWNCLPNQLHKAYVAVVPYPFQDQDNRLPGRLLCNDPILER